MNEFGVCKQTMNITFGYKVEARKPGLSPIFYALSRFDGDNG